jgi:hypothetical protein
MTMRLEDWPIDFDDSRAYCAYTDAKTANCLDVLATTLTLVTPRLGVLIGSIVEHAKSAHGIEIKPSGYWYRSFTPDGELWSESSDVDDYGPVDLDGMEGEELEHFAKRNEIEKTLTYQRIAVYTLSVVEEWKPDGNASTA